MDSQVYTDPSVASYMNDHFVSVRMDGETEYGRTYAAAQELEGYPSMFIFSREGEPVSKIVGFTPADEMVSTLKGIVVNFRELRIYRAKYQRGELDDNEFAEYIGVAREMGNEKMAEKLTAEYVEQIMDSKLTDKDIRVVAHYMDVEDIWWPELYSNQERLRRVLGDDYMLALEKIYNNSLRKAVDENKIQIISIMSNELAPLVTIEETNSWDLRSLPFLQFYYYTNQVEELIAYVDRRFETDRKEDHEWLYGAASQITNMDQQYRTESLLHKEVEWFQHCIDLEEKFDYYFYHGMVLFLLKKQEEAKSSFIKAEILVSSDDEQSMIDQVMQLFPEQ
jgi:hypothetical protein